MVSSLVLGERFRCRVRSIAYRTPKALLIILEVLLTLAMHRPTRIADVDIALLTVLLGATRILRHFHH